MKSVYRLLGAALITFAVFPCAVDTSPSFVPVHAPEKFDKAFVRGELGILATTLSDRYKLIAWRYLDGLPPGQEEQEALVVKPQASDTGSYEAIAAWDKVRQSAGLAPVFFVSAKVSRIDKGAYYTNCLPDAFATATATFNDRQQSYGDKALLTAWATAQDRVFQNCMGRAAAYPADPGAGMPPLARADRMYQIAAAHFYAEDLEGAEQRFRAIAADASSPWHETAAYMVARTLIREDSLMHKPGALADAKAQLEGLGAGPLHDSAQSLLSYVNTLSDPIPVLKVLGDKLAVPHSGADMAAAIDEGNFVLNSGRWAKVLAKPDMPEPFDWVHALESHSASYAVQRWQQSRSELWLVAALMLAGAKDSAAPDLIEAGLKVPESSPAFDTATFHALRLMIAGGQSDAARRKLDLLLSGKRRNLDSVDNAFRGERMSVATGFDDYLRWAPRRPIGLGEDEGPVADQPVDDSPILDNDSAKVLNLFTPLSKLVAAAESPRLPEWPRTQIAISAWTRALLLGNDEAANRMTPVLEKAHPSWTADLEVFRTATGDAKRFAAAMAVERHADFHVRLLSDFRPKPGPDGWGEDWWCAATLPAQTDTAPPDAVLSPAEKAEGVREVQRLHDAGPAQSSLAPVVMGWAKAHPEDSRVPEALARLVRITRYGCRFGGGDHNGLVSKAAFDMLHAKYPDSTWARQTPYWFN